MGEAQAYKLTGSGFAGRGAVVDIQRASLAHYILNSLCVRVARWPMVMSPTWRVAQPVGGRRRCPAMVVDAPRRHGGPACVARAYFPVYIYIFIYDEVIFDGRLRSFVHPITASF